MLEQRNSRVRGGHAQSPSQGREHHAFGEQLSDHPAASGSQGRSDRELAAARAGARQGQVRHVDTADHQNEPDRHDEHEQLLRGAEQDLVAQRKQDRKSTRLNSSHPSISYAVFCLKKKKKIQTTPYDVINQYIKKRQR